MSVARANIIHTQDVHDGIENRRQEQDHANHERHHERDYDYHGPYYDKSHRHHSLTRGHSKVGIKPFSHEVRRVRWPLNFIEKYDGSTNPAEWLEVYQLATEAAGGDSYVMANYLPICLSSSARSWLMGLPIGSVCSWSDLCWQFIHNFRAMCA
jgi:hypothetical protein